MSKSDLYVVCCLCGAGHLKVALAERLIPLGDNCDFWPWLTPVGPLELVDQPAEHLRWVERNAPTLVRWAVVDPERFVRESTSAWRRIDTWDGPIVLVYHSRHVEERSLYLTFARRADLFGRATIVDMATREPSKLSTGDCSHEVLATAIQESGPPDEATRLAARAELLRLAEGPFGLRTLDARGMHNVPFDAFDERILSTLDQEWTPALDWVRTILEDCRTRGYVDITPSILAWRIEILTQQGLMERRGASEKPPWDDPPWLGDVRRT